MVISKFTPKDPQTPIPVTGTTYTPICIICGSADQVHLTADPDRGGLLICVDCRRLFGFEGNHDR